MIFNRDNRLYTHSFPAAVESSQPSVHKSDVQNTGVLGRFD